MPTAIEMMKILFCVFLYSIPVWIFITQPLYEKGKEIALANKLKQEKII